MSNFWGTLNIPLINCKVNLILTCSKNCVLTDIKIQDVAPEQEDNQPRLAINAPTGVTFDISDTKLYISIVTLSTEDYNKLLQHLNTRFKRTVRWRKYRSEISNQPKNKSTICQLLILNVRMRQLTRKCSLTFQLKINLKYVERL